MLPTCKAWTNQSQGVYDVKAGGFRRMGRWHNKGVADIIGIYRGRMLCIEVKSAKGKLSPHQDVWLKQMHALGAIAFVARSVAEVAKELKRIGEMMSVQSELNRS